jgi:nucleoid-associated protein YgaU
MPIRMGVAAGVLVLVGGVGVALMFRTTASTPTAAVFHDEPIRRRVDDGPRFLMEVRSAPPEAVLPSDAAEAPATAARSMDLLTGLPLFEAREAMLPKLQRNYPPPADEHTGLIDQSTPAEHRVVDGDTLASIAQRYLGDAQHAPEIFEANRDVLTNPELLPIGAVLKIPARE